MTGNLLALTVIADLLAALNGYHPRLKFTIENEVNHTLPFLDVLVSLDHEGFHTSVYTKPTSTHRFLDFTSPSPPAHKFATAQTLLRRAITYPDKHQEQQRQITQWSQVYGKTKQLPPSLYPYCLTPRPSRRTNSYSGNRGFGSHRIT